MKGCLDPALFSHHHFVGTLYHIASIKSLIEVTFSLFANIFPSKMFNFHHVSTSNYVQV